MGRNLLGALLYVGQGRQEPVWIDDLLAQRDRRRAAPTFAPDGLYLANVEYPAGFSLPIVAAAAALFLHLGIPPVRTRGFYQEYSQRVSYRIHPFLRHCAPACVRGSRASYHYASSCRTLYIPSVFIKTT